MTLEQSSDPQKKSLFHLHADDVNTLNNPDIYSGGLTRHTALIPVLKRAGVQVWPAFQEVGQKSDLIIIATYRYVIFLPELMLSDS